MVGYFQTKHLTALLLICIPNLQASFPTFHCCLQTCLLEKAGAVSANVCSRRGKIVWRTAYSVCVPCGCKDG